MRFNLVAVLLLAQMSQIPSTISPKSSINYSQNTEIIIAKTPIYNMPICRKISDQYAEKLDKIDPRPL